MLAMTHTSEGHLGALSYWAGICGLLFITITAILAPLYGSRRTVKSLGKPNGQGNNLFEVGKQAADNALAAKILAQETAEHVDKNFAMIFNRLTHQDNKIDTFLDAVRKKHKKRRR